MTDEKAKEILEAVRRLDVTVRKENLETRAHIGNEVATVRNDGAITKNFASRVFTGIKRLLTKMGVKADDL